MRNTRPNEERRVVSGNGEERGLLKPCPKQIVKVKLFVAMRKLPLTNLATNISGYRLDSCDFSPIIMTSLRAVLLPVGLG